MWFILGLSKFQGPVTRFCGLYSWDIWRGISFLSLRAGDTAPSCLSRWTKQRSVQTCTNKDQVFFSHLHQKIPRFFLASRLSSPSNKSQLNGGRRSIFSNQQGDFKMPWTFEVLCNYVFISSYVQVLGGEGNPSTTGEHKLEPTAWSPEFGHIVVNFWRELQMCLNWLILNVSLL